MILTSLHPGCTVEQVQESLGWKVKIHSDIKITSEPQPEELRIIREELDPNHLYI